MNKTTAATILAVFVQTTGTILAFMLFQKGLSFEVGGGDWCMGGSILFLITCFVSLIVFGLITGSEYISKLMDY